MIWQPGIPGDASVEAPLGYPDYALGGHLDYNPFLDPPPSNLWENVGNEGNDLRG